MFAQAMVIMTRELPPESHALLHCAGIQLPTEQTTRVEIQSANGGGQFITGELRPATTERQTASKVRRHRRSDHSS